MSAGESGGGAGSVLGAARAAVAAGAATATVMAGVGAWLGAQQEKLHESEIRTLEQTHEGALLTVTNVHESDLRRQEREAQDALDDLRDALEARLQAKEIELADARMKERQARDSAGREQQEKIDALTERVGALVEKITLYEDTDGKAVVFDFDRIYGPVLDRDLSNRHAQLYGGRVYAIKRFEGAQDGQLTLHRLLEGTVAKFLTKDGTDLDVVAYQDEDGAARRFETFWQLGPTVTVEEARGAFRRMAPHVSVRRYAADEIGSEDSNQFVAGKPELFLFLKEFNEKMQHATRRKLELQVRRLRQEGSLYFAHFRTRLNDVEVNGTLQDRLFVHELLLTAPTLEGVFVFKGAFTSSDPFYVKSPHWPQVADWWLNLRINPA